jgi:hypothetical protein
MHNAAMAQQAAEPAAQAKVPAVEIEQRTNADYKTSANFWQQQVAANATNEEAWLNLYKATRYASYTEHSRTIASDNQMKLNDVLARMNNAVPNSFAFNYCTFLNSNRNDEAVAYLKKAYNLKPEEQELWDDMLCEAIIANDDASKLLFSKKLSEKKIYSDAEMEYNRNVLNSVERNGVLITHGNVDTYPIIMLQQLYALRTDVQVICLDWYGSQRYLNTTKQLLGLKEGKLNKDDLNASLQNILAGAEGKTTYMALTLPPTMLQDNAKNLYCTGLAMKYSKTELQNLESLKFNWESLFQKNFINSTDDINKNYLVPLLFLRKAYTAMGDAAHAEGVRGMAEQMANRFALKNKIQKHLD